MPFDDPDAKFERALAQHLRDGSAQANCPDAETLAAYHERNLSLEEMARWKEHISACEACQETLALVETTENQLSEDWKEKEIPVLEAASILGVHAGEMPKRSAKAPATGEPEAARSPVATLRHRPALLRWAIPLGAVAAGVLVFIGIYEQRAKKVAGYPDTVIARREAPLAPSPALEQQQSKVQQQSEPKDEELSAPATSREKREMAVPAAPSPGLAERTRTGERAAWTSASTGYGSPVEKKVPPAQPAPAPNLPAQADKDAATSENAPAIAGALRAAPPPPAPPVGVGGTAGAGSARSRTDAKSASPAVTESVTVQPEAAPLNGRNNNMKMKQGIANEVVDLTGSATGLILTPDNRVFWKLQPAGAVQLTTDGGKKWKSLDTGATSQLTAGAAPSSKVCWIAGKAGTLVLTMDRGGHWTRISTPISGDLGGVHAADARHASIWDAASQISYETFDGGATWKQTSGK